ncbi:hypothetical protein AMJ74_05630 [candidate division WOR_3 bacterium SM1_77]|jgi:hypothetical protein|uniref:Uncharacterized protein n=1 Tax=candidate division WOR_3 bacterium SM1_77 TaxID=1703778 RepID=A0A0S8JXA4_UNCW3|nr:MAG: hypothetical protein AMJ74_05630 [candidate division WOR_3 bacterium SM1_77]
MVNVVLLYLGSVIIIIWGIAHLVPTGSIVKGFGEISRDNRLIITMDWIAEGLTLCFIGLLVLFVTVFAGSASPGAKIVYRLSFAMLVVLSVLSFFTGARTSVLPMKICPFVKLLVAACLVPSLI